MYGDEAALHLDQWLKL
jgi:hypothetical protein